jgi:hypothetical protein
MKVIKMRKLHNVRKMTGATNANATATATNESNTIALHLDLQQFVGLAVDYTIAHNSLEPLSMAMKPFLARYIAAGYTTISAGPKGKGQAPTPKPNELSYVEIKGLFDGKCTAGGIVYSKDALASGKSQYSNAINQFIQNFKLALTTGDWGTGNSSRDKKAIENDTAEPKEKSARGSKQRKAPTVDSVAKSLLDKGLTTQQLLDVLTKVCKECSCDEWSYNVVKTDHPKKTK